MDIAANPQGMAAYVDQTAVAAVRKPVPEREQVSRKQVAEGLDASRHSEHSAASRARAEHRRGHHLDIQA
ncbi:MAG: hypothetical protein WCF16_07745 [Alphaproteobacteria bacterium]